MALSEPYKIKEVKHLPHLAPYERWNLLKKVDFNLLRLSSDHVTFDLSARGMSSWSHFQKAGYQTGDEAYAGSRNYLRLVEAAEATLGIGQLVPTHNGIGAEKLLVTTLLKPGQTVMHNRGVCGGLVSFSGGISTDVTTDRAAKYEDPGCFGADLDIDRIKSIIQSKGPRKIAYIQVELCPDNWCGQPVSLENIEALRDLAAETGIPLAIDISNVLENALWINRSGHCPHSGLLDTSRKIIACADIILMDASQDCRSDTGGFITSRNEEIFNRLRNQVVVFEGLHTYGGMTGRAMEVFATGLSEMSRQEYTEWYDSQVELLHSLIGGNGVPVKRGTKGIGLATDKFLPHLDEQDYPKFVLAASLYIGGGIRPRIAGLSMYHINGEGRRMLSLEIPRLAYTKSHIESIAESVTSVFHKQKSIQGLELKSENPEFVDELNFEPRNQRLFVHLGKNNSWEELQYEPHKIAIFEPIKISGKAKRKKAISGAGYNTFLLNSEDVYIDLLTDSGTTAMSSYQWEGMTNSADTSFNSRHYKDFIEEFSAILGYKHIIPTHQGRAAEHIMSQVMISEGQVVPGNMYFTTTKLHQEMAGGIFADVIVDEAHQPYSEFGWKGNIDIKKLRDLINLKGGPGIAYVSYEMSVNMAGGQPFSMDNAKEVSALCQQHGIPLMYDATRCVENARMIKMKDSAYSHRSVAAILKELMSYGDGCTISCKKDFMVNMGGLLACNDDQLAKQFNRMLRIWEGDLTTGGLDPKDMEALRRGLLDSLNDDYIASRVAQTQELGHKLTQAGIPIVQPPGTHAIFIDAKKFLPHLDQDEFPAQALAAAIYIETGVRSMERGNVSKGRNPDTGQNYRPDLELVRLTIPRRVYSNSHFDYVVDGIRHLWTEREKISGLRFTYEPNVLRFFQGRFEPLHPWEF